MNDLTTLPNISKIISDKLSIVGINSKEELLKIGSKDAFIKIQFYDSSACLSMLYSLEGAIKNIRWHHLSDNKKKN